MARTNTYAHYCAVARSLEIIGEKWSLLVVRDLLRGPQRFSDLQRYLGGITPKRLTARLRDLEAAGIVARVPSPSERGDRYGLTETGKDLRPVVEALAMWGVEHALRPRLPDEPLYPEMFLQVTCAYLNRSATNPGRPLRWEFRFNDGHRPETLTYDGMHWASTREIADRPDVVIDTTAGELLDFLTERPKRPQLYERFRVNGEPEDVALFRRTFVRERAEARLP